MSSSITIRLENRGENKNVNRLVAHYKNYEQLSSRQYHQKNLEKFIYYDKKSIKTVKNTEFSQPLLKK